MSKFYRTVSFLFWLLGLITVIGAVFCRLVPRLNVSEKVEIRSLLWLAGVLFLGAITTWTRERTATA